MIITNAALRGREGTWDLHIENANFGSIVASPADSDNRDGPELLDNVNPTFTWVRLAQRIPVRIRLTNIPPDVLVSAGMTCTVVLKDGAHPQIGATAKRLLGAIRDWFTGETVVSAEMSALLHRLFA